MDIENFKKAVEQLMLQYDLRGIEIIRPYHENCISIRACGKGMIHPEGTSLQGVPVWESINDMLHDEDKVVIP